MATTIIKGHIHFSSTQRFCLNIPSFEIAQLKRNNLCRKGCESCSLFPCGKTVINCYINSMCVQCVEKWCLGPHMYKNKQL